MEPRDNTQPPSLNIREALVRVIEDLDLFVGICDADFRPLFVNGRGRRLCGIDADAPMPPDVFGFFRPEDRDFVANEFFPSVRRNGQAEVEIPFVHQKTGELIWMNYKVASIVEGGRLRGFATVSQSIQIHKLRELNLQQQRSELQERESRMRLANTAAQIGTFELDLDTGHIVWSDNLYRMLRVDPAGFQLNFENFLSLVHPADRERVQAAVQEALRTGKEYNTEFRMIRPDGSMRWTAARGQMLRDEDGKPYRFVGVDVDITRLKEAEAVLLDQNQRINEMADALPEVIFCADPDGQVTYVNRRWREYTGTSNASALSQVWPENIHPDDREGAVRAWQSSVDSGTPLEHEYRLRHRDGSFRWNLSRVVPIRDESGVILRWIGSITDIDDLKRAQERSRAVEDDFKFILDFVPQIIWTTDAEGMAETFNHAWTEYTGLSFAQSLGLQWSSIIHPSDLPQLERTWRNSLRSGDPYVHEARYRGKDGSYRRFLIRAQALRDEGGNIIRWFGSSTDIEAQRRQEELLLQSERLSTAIKLASAIAHEVNNPLAAVVNALYLVSEDPALDERTRTYVNLASEELVRVSHIVRQNLAFYRERQDLQSLRLASIVEEVVGFLKRQIESRNIRIETRFDSKEMVSGVETELRQLVANLLLNALEACPDGSTIQIRTRTTSHSGRSLVRLTVANSGGISDTIRARLFEPFVSSSSDKGKGLGLWVARGIVHKHHGEIRIRSSARSGRTVAFVTLPSANHTVASEASSTSAAK